MESESLKPKHINNVRFYGIKFVFHEGLDLWYDMVDVSSVEVSVVHDIGDHFVVSALIDLFSCLYKGSELDPVVLVNHFDFKGHVLH